MGGVFQPAWLAEWLRGSCSRLEALKHVDGLGPIEPQEMFGRWRGRSCPTGHPLDGLLERLGWYGKAFEPPDRAHPLLFRTPSGELVALDPSLLPLSVPLGLPGLAGSAASRLGFNAMRSLLSTRRPAARLRRLRYRGVLSTAMVYEKKPITDHFRSISADAVLGIMETPRAAPYFFLLERDPPSGSAAATRGLPGT